MKGKKEVMQHCSRLNNKNKYKNKTILINIDNYDVVGEKETVYDSKIYISKYYKNIYEYINILHINLDSLREKIYNKRELDWIEKQLLIFVEQDKRNLIGKVEKEVKEIMDYMERLDFKEGDPVTYNYLEAEKVRKEMAIEHEMKVKKKEEALQKQEINLQKQEINIEKREKSLEEEKITLAKELKNAGFPINKILKITKLSEKIVTML